MTTQKHIDWLNGLGPAYCVTDSSLLPEQRLLDSQYRKTSFLDQKEWHSGWSTISIDRVVEQYVALIKETCLASTPEAQEYFRSHPDRAVEVLYPTHFGSKALRDAATLAVELVDILAQEQDRTFSVADVIYQALSFVAFERNSSLGKESLADLVAAARERNPKIYDEPGSAQKIDIAPIVAGGMYADHRNKSKFVKGDRSDAREERIYQPPKDIDKVKEQILEPKSFKSFPELTKDYYNSIRRYLNSRSNEYPLRYYGKLINEIPTINYPKEKYHYIDLSKCSQIKKYINEHFPINPKSTEPDTK